MAECSQDNLLLMSGFHSWPDMSDRPDSESSSSTLGPAPGTGGVATLSPLSDTPLSQENSGSGAEGVQEVEGEGPGTGTGESLAFLVADPS